MKPNVNWKEYFEKRIGNGFLATSNKEGEVDIAIYSRPHIFDDRNFYFIVNQGRTHENLRQNPFAAYAFGQGNFQGFRFYLRLIELLDNGPKYEEVIAESRKPSYIKDGGKNKYVAVFSLEEIRPLVGG